MSPIGWIGVDLDGTLAHYGGWVGVNHIGDPVPAMLARVKEWLNSGVEVRIFTARVYGQIPGDRVFKVIENWCELHLGKVLPITCTKDYGMVELWDDRAIQVRINTGERVDGVE